MADIIHLLPDSVANQIAAGEVIQRPASAVKELLENAVDAKATEIKLIVKDAGRTLIQVIDNGSGMSETDARMSFERHATSKVQSADDLFQIKTKGFRGEALASIAAIAQVQLKTRKTEDNIGTCIEIEGSELKKQEPCSCAVGTSFSVKNLFFNVPARRNFLKSDPIEFKHILEEFERVAIPHFDIGFTLHHNGEEIYHLKAGNLKQRLIAVLGSNYNERLVPVTESTNIVNVNGYVGKPESALKKRGDQYFFVNNRFIKSPYLEHAVKGAFEELLPRDAHASYFLFLNVDPSTIDINIHPTKTEIKFEDEKSIYAIIRSSVKRALGQHNLTPTIDFEQEMAFKNIPLKPEKGYVEAPQIKVNTNYNPFVENAGGQASYSRERKPTKDWQQLYNITKNEVPAEKFEKQAEQLKHKLEEKEENKVVFQLHNKYIVSPVLSGLLFIDQQGAHERVLYEAFSRSIDNNKGASQQELFPKTLQLNAPDFELMKEVLDEIKAVGFDISEFGKNTFVIHGIPADLPDHDSIELLESLIDQYRQNLSELKINKRDNIARSLAKRSAIKSGKTLSVTEMKNLIDQLFACEAPNYAPDGRSIVTILNAESIGNLFEK